jgi:hypothetical protein
VGHVARLGENVYWLLVGKPKGKKPLRKPRIRWIDSIIMDVIEIVLGVVDWIGLAQDSDRWRACELGNEPSGSIKCWQTTEWLHNL